MNSLCKQYISEVKLLLPAIGKSEKNYLASLTSNLEDFCDDTSPQTIDDLYKEFGTPVDTINFYISTFSIADAVAEFPLLLDETDCIFHSEE